MQAQLFLEAIFAPYIDGVCISWGVSPQEALQILIKEEAVFGKIAEDNPRELAALLNHPPIKAMVNIGSPLKDVSDEWIREKSDILFQVMMEIRPELARGIVENPGGTEWFYQSMIGLKEVLYDEPHINIETP